MVPATASGIHHHRSQNGHHLTAGRSFPQKGARIPVRRASSLLGTIKNLVTAPLAWFAPPEEDFEQAIEENSQKRRRIPPAPPLTASVVTAQPVDQDYDFDYARPDHDPSLKATKRLRLDKRGGRQDGEDEDRMHAYLDPPPALLNHNAGHAQRSQSEVRTSPSLATNRMHVHRASLPTSKLSHRTFSPYATASNLHRTMSVDPPARAPAAGRDASMVSIPRTSPLRASPIRTSLSVGQPVAPRSGSAMRDSSTPAPASFRFRSSLTPAPSGQGFGPSPDRKARDPSEPPPLSTLVSKPMFIRPPEARSLSLQPTTAATTLGTLVESRRASISPARQMSVASIGPTVTYDPNNTVRTANAAEKALHELDVYKTPLLPTRLQQANLPGIPELFRERKSKFPPRRKHKGEDDIAALGGVWIPSKEPRKSKKATVEDVRDEDEVEQLNGTKPYAGKGGMKKLLARRKKEEREKEKVDPVALEEDESMEGDDAVTPSVIAASAPQPTSQAATERPVLSPFASLDRGALAPTGRVGRVKQRQHISRPARPDRNGGGGRFSAEYDEEDSTVMDEQREREIREIEEAVKKAPAFSVPSGFSFAKADASAPLSDPLKEKEPPLASLPFSFGAAPTSRPPSVPASAPTAPSPVPSSLFARPSSAAATAPASSADHVEGKVPNFFASSTSTTASVVPVPSPTPSNLFGAPKDGAAPKSLFGGEAVKSPFGGNEPAKMAMVSRPPSEPVMSAFGSDTNGTFGSSKLEPVNTAAPPPTSSLFGSTPTAEAKPAFGGFSKPSDATSASADSSSSTTNGTSLAPPLSLFGAAAAKSVSTPAPAPASNSGFSFGAAPAKPVEEVKTVEPASTGFSFGAPPKPATEQPVTPAPFSFGVKSEPAAEASKPSTLFGNAPTGGGFGGFGTSTPAAPAATPAAEPPKPAFAFGTPAPSSPAVEAPKPLFGGSGGFSFGQSTKTPDPEASKTAFSFGAAPATPPAVDKKASTPFTFGSSAPAATPAPTGGMFSFAAASSNTTASAAPKPFEFGNSSSVPARPVTPPKQELEMNMDESPTRGVAEPSKPSDGYPFPSSGTTGGFGQSSASTSFAFGSSTTPASNPFGAKPDANAAAKPAGGGFSFGGQSSNNTAGSGFSFGQKPEPAPALTTSFSFGQQSNAAPLTPATPAPFSFGSGTTPTSSNAPFAFGAGSSAGGGFGQNTSSAPGSPAPFAFSSPTTSTAPAPFAFGSQPASPATGATGLPAPAFGFGQGSGTPPTSAGGTTAPFGAGAGGTPAPATPGGTLFTMGSSAQPGPAGNRPVKKMPNRRGKR